MKRINGNLTVGEKCSHARFDNAVNFCYTCYDRHCEIAKITPTDEGQCEVCEEEVPTFMRVNNEKI